MFWEEDEDKSLPYEIPEDIVDISFGIKSKKLPIDHAWALSQAIETAIPWSKDEPKFRAHQIHVAETGNGWLRPENTEDQWLWPSRRTRLYLRVPQHRVEDTKKLIGQTLDIDNCPVTLGTERIRKLTNTSVIFSRYILSAEDEDENDFLARMHQEIIDLTGIKMRKMICGISHNIETPEGNLHTRHLMIADLESNPSIKIQQHGLGDGHLLGCGIFLPHKGIKSLNASE